MEIPYRGVNLMGETPKFDCKYLMAYQIFAVKLSLLVHKFYWQL